RSHSGFFGIVNSEEGYQNLRRFLFGDVRADGRLEVDELTLPPAVQAEFDKGKDVKASYQFEVSVSVRGKAWQLHRRTANENSAIFRKYDDLFDWDRDTKTATPKREASPVLFNVFLDRGQSQTGKSLAFAADLCVRASDYQVDGLLFFKNHFEGGYLFRDMVTMEATPPTKKDGDWIIEYRFGNAGGPPKRAKIVEDDDDVLTFEIPIEQPNPPGIKARLRVETRYW